MYRLILILSLTNLVNILVLTQSSDSTSPVLSSRAKKSNYLVFGGKTYYFGIVFKANFYRAMQFCTQQGMQLVSITSQEENDRLGKYAAEIGVPSNHFWTSGTNHVGDDQWIWLSTGNNMVYTNWHPGEPSGKGRGNNWTENCAEVVHWDGFTWNDLDCAYHRIYFICEKFNDCDKK